MPDWSIKIIPANGGAAFVPDLKGAQPGDPLQAQESDLVTWNNTTHDSHQLWQTDVNFTPFADGALCDEILPNRSSRPSYNLTVPKGTKTGSTVTIYYCCKLHPQERGSIQVTAL
jgi:hypothetical protein